MGEKQVRLKKDGNVFYSPIVNKERQLERGAKLYPHRIWRKKDWKEYYLPKLKPPRLTDRQWQLIMLILSLLGAAILAHGSTLVLE